MIVSIDTIRRIAVCIVVLLSGHVHVIATQHMQNGDILRSKNSSRVEKIVCLFRNKVEEKNVSIVTV